MRRLLDQPHLSVITRHADGELVRVQDIIEHKVLVEGRGDLEVMFGDLLAAPGPSHLKTLDLIGHSTAGTSLLELGTWVIDGANTTVTAFFRELADQDVLGRLGITSVRLLGCRTADTTAGRATINTLAEILGVEVYGTRNLIYSAHYDRGGFADNRTYALIGNRELADERKEAAPVVAGEPWPQALDIDALPLDSAIVRRGAWVHRAATEAEMGEILRLVRRRDGARMPGLLSAPLCEIIFPASEPATYRRAQVVLGGEFLRFYPQGDASPGVVYAVDDPHALVKLVDALRPLSA